MVAYAQSKLSNLLFAFELDRRLTAAGIDDVLSVGAHPGYAATNLQFRGPEASGSTLRTAAWAVANAVFAQSAEQGALPMLYAATAEDVIGGEYVGPGGLFDMRGSPEFQPSNDASRTRKPPSSSGGRNRPHRRGIRFRAYLRTVDGAAATRVGTEKPHFFSAGVTPASACTVGRPGLRTAAETAFDHVAIEFARREPDSTPSRSSTNPARRAWEMTQELELYLTTCQVGITASSIAVGIVAEPALAALFEPLFAGTTLATIGAGALIAYLIINLLHLTHGEQTPTYLGVERSRMVCRYGATPLHWFYVGISPLIKSATASPSGRSGCSASRCPARGSKPKSIASSPGASCETNSAPFWTAATYPTSAARRSSPRSASATASQRGDGPAGDIVALSPTDDDATNAERIAETPHTRYPLVGEALEEFLGIVYIPALVDEREEQAGDGGLLDRIDLEAVASPRMTMSPDTTVSDAIDQFQAERQELAFVLEDGDVVGLVTVTDLLEEVVGDIRTRWTPKLALTTLEHDFRVDDTET